MPVSIKHSIIRRSVTAFSLLSLAGVVAAAPPAPVATKAAAAKTVASAKPSQPPAPAVVNPSKTTFKVSFENNQLTLVDPATNRTLISPSGMPVSWAASITPTVKTTIVPNGADIAVTYANDTDKTQRLSTLLVGGIRMGPEVTFWSFYDGLMGIPLKNYASYNAVYPNILYSPVMAFSDSKYTLGVSLLYPVTEYNHSVQVYLCGIPGGTTTNGGPQYSAQFVMNVDLPAHQTRTYTVAVRACMVDENVLTVLTPYRDYFQSLYGAVKYTRDPRPVTGQMISTPEFCTDSNPRGFIAESYKYRPDQYGFKPWVNEFLTNYVSKDQAQRLMVWTPSGCYRFNKQNNFPTRFMTGLRDLPKAEASLKEFLAIPAAKTDLGFWWGRSTCIDRGWDSKEYDGVDPRNPAKVKAAFDELDMAVSAGATMIGLDAFTLTPPADAAAWLKLLIAHAPSVRFITEASLPDYLHNLAPTYHEGKNVRGPFILGDFLNPGHETWASIMVWPSKTPSKVATTAEQTTELQRFTDMGYVPVTFGHVFKPKGMVAAESWKTSVPTTLQASSPLKAGSSSATQSSKSGMTVVAAPTATPAGVGTFRNAPIPGTTITVQANKSSTAPQSQAPKVYTNAESPKN